MLISILHLYRINSKKKYFYIIFSHYLEYFSLPVFWYSKNFKDYWFLYQSPLYLTLSFGYSCCYPGKIPVLITLRGLCSSQKKIVFLFQVIIIFILLRESSRAFLQKKNLFLSKVICSKVLLPRLFILTRFCQTISFVENLECAWWAIKSKHFPFFYQTRFPAVCLLLLLLLSLSCWFYLFWSLCPKIFQNPYMKFLFFHCTMEGICTIFNIFPSSSDSLFLSSFARSPCPSSTRWTFQVIQFHITEWYVLVSVEYHWPMN